jgi:hypothetical protein
MSGGPMDDDGETVTTTYTNPWIAEYKRRRAMLMEMRAFEVIALMRDLNLTSYAFGKNAETTGPYPAVPGDWSEPAVQC